MKTASWAGIVLLVLGALSLAFQGVSWTTHKKVLDIGPIQATEAQEHSLPLPPVLGCLSLMGGIVLVAIGTRNESVARQN